jgi:ABC-type amino acid transport substrate-binding protein
MRNRALAALIALAAAGASAASVEEIRQSGRLRIAVYTDFAPFSDDGHGIDVDVGVAVARSLGVDAELVPFKDADSVDDDLRNMIWKGHYLWKNRLADAMLHVPVDLAPKIGQVRIVGPYFREQLVVARNEKRVPQLPTLQAFSSEKIGVQFGTVEDHYLIHSFAGLLRENVVHFASVEDAMAGLRRGEVAAVMGGRSHVEAGLADAPFPVAAVATPGLHPTAWDLGVAVNADNPELARIIDAAMAELRRHGTIQRIFAAHGLTWTAPVSGQ